MRSFILNTVSRLISVVTIFCIIYFVLLNDFLGSSIDTIIDDVKSLNPMCHLLVFGLLPIYIGLVIYGVTVIGIYLRPRIHKILNNLFSSKK